VKKWKDVRGEDENVVGSGGCWDQKGRPYQGPSPKASHMLEEVVAEVRVAVDERM
jgi:hypothetical protein